MTIMSTQTINDIQYLYEQFTDGYEPSDFINREWPMKDGMYQQYSGYDTEDLGITGIYSITN